jgi:hypothetical protein
MGSGANALISPHRLVGRQPLYVTAFASPATGKTFWYLSNGVSKPFFEAQLETSRARPKRRRTHHPAGPRQCRMAKPAKGSVERSSVEWLAEAWPSRLEDSRWHPPRLPAALYSRMVAKVVVTTKAGTQREMPSYLGCRRQLVTTFCLQAGN